MARVPTDEQIRNASHQEIVRRARQWGNYNAVSQCRTGGMGLLLSDEQIALLDELDELNHDWSFHSLNNDQLDAALASLRSAQS